MRSRENQQMDAGAGQIQGLNCRCLKGESGNQRVPVVTGSSPEVAFSVVHAVVAQRRRLISASVAEERRSGPELWGPGSGRAQARSQKGRDIDPERSACMLEPDLCARGTLFSPHSAPFPLTVI